MGYEVTAGPILQEPEQKSMSDLYPKDYERFKTKCHQRLTKIEDTVASLRTRLSDHTSHAQQVDAKLE